MLIHHKGDASLRAVGDFRLLTGLLVFLRVLHRLLHDVLRFCLYDRVDGNRGEFLEPRFWRIKRKWKRVSAYLILTITKGREREAKDSPENDVVSLHNVNFLM